MPASSIGRLSTSLGTRGVFSSPARRKFQGCSRTPKKFWKLEEEYSEDYVARRRIELEAQSPLALKDAVVTGNAAGTSNVRPRAPPEWLGEDPGARVHAGSSEEVVPAAASSQRNVRFRISPDHAQQHPLAHEGSAAESDEECVYSARCRSGSP